MIIALLMAGILLGFVLSADARIAVAEQRVSDSEARYLGPADYVQRRPDFGHPYKAPLMGMEVNSGWGELKSGQRLSGVEIHSVSPGGPSAAAGMRGRRVAVRTALTVALTAGALFFPPAVVGAIAVHRSGLGESHDLIMAVDGQRTRNLDDFMRAIDEAEAGQIVYLTVIRKGASPRCLSTQSAGT